MTTFFCSDSLGSDAWDGLSSNRPLKSLDALYGSLEPGDTGLLREGDTWTHPFPRWDKSSVELDTYSDGGSVNSPVIMCGDGEIPIHFRGFVSDVIIRNVSFIGSRKAIDGHNAYKIRIESCLFDDANVTFRIGGSGDSSFPLSHLTFHDNVFMNCRETALGIGDASHVRISANNFLDNGLENPVHNHHVYMWASQSKDYAGAGVPSFNNRIVRNSFQRAFGNYAIKFRTQNSGLIAYNRLLNNRNAISVCTQWPDDRGHNNRVLGNMIVEGLKEAGNHARGLDISGQSNLKVMENIWDGRGHDKFNPCIIVGRPPGYGHSSVASDAEWSPNVGLYFRDNQIRNRGDSRPMWLEHEDVAVYDAVSEDQTFELPDWVEKK